MGKNYPRFKRGTHLIAEFEASINLDNHTDYLKVILEILTDVGITVIDESHHIFENGSFTSTILLAESHINIHTWPEYQTIYFDIFVCNFSRDNSDTVSIIYEKTKAFFEAKNDNVTLLKR